MCVRVDRSVGQEVIETTFTKIRCIAVNKIPTQPIDRYLKDQTWLCKHLCRQAKN